MSDTVEVQAHQNTICGRGRAGKGAMSSTGIHSISATCTGCSLRDQRNAATNVPKAPPGLEMGAQSRVLSGPDKRFAILDNFCLGLVEREVEGSIPGSGYI